MTEPTDNELDAVIAEYQTRIYPQDMHPRFERAIMRAVLAKWGTPSAVAGEPVAIYHGRCTIDCGAHGHLDMELLKMIPAGARLYTAPQPTQAQAGAVTLTDEQIDAAAKKLAECMEYPWEFMPEPGRKNMRKHAQDVIEAAHGIKGGQHG